MNSRLIIVNSALAGLALSSCYPITGRPPNPNPNPQSQQLTSEQLEAQELERMRIAEREAELLRQQQQFHNPDTGDTNPVGPTDYPFASKVPGKAGFVFSPYNKQVVDVRDIPSGTLVQDPTYPASEKKYFRVP